MAGNTWEWCSDWYRPDAYATHSLKDPQGSASSLDPQEPGIPKRVQRGVCSCAAAPNASTICPALEARGAADSAALHVEFRCVKSPGFRSSG